MPKQPPREWMDHCITGVEKDPKVTDAGAVCGALWAHKMSPKAKKKALAKYESGEDPFDINLLEAQTYSWDELDDMAKQKAFQDYKDVAGVSRDMSLEQFLKLEPGTFDHLIFDDSGEALDPALYQENKMKEENEKGLKTLVKTGGNKVGEVIDLLGATKKGLKNMVSSFEHMRDEAGDRIMDQDKYWAYVIKGVKAEHKITDHALMQAGLSVPMLMEVLDLSEQEPMKTTNSFGLTYKTMQLKKKDGSTKALPLNDVLTKITPFTKQFTNPIQSLVMGDPDAILKVIQHLYGQDIVQWSVPAVKESSIGQSLKAVALVELYNLAKFDKESSLFEKAEGRFIINEESVKALVDAFDKQSKEYLFQMFPNIIPEYVETLLKETKTVINTLSTDEMARLFPNIDKIYLINIKERAELEELAKTLETCVGVSKKPELKLKKKKKKLKKEAVDEKEDFTNEEIDMIVFLLNESGIRVADLARGTEDEGGAQERLREIDGLIDKMKRLKKK